MEKWVAETRAGNGEPRVAKVSECRIGIAGRRSRGPGSMVPRAYPRASRRRGLGEDSTAGSGLARRFCDTPGEYPPRAFGDRPEASADGPPTFDTPLARALSSAGRRTRVCAYGRQARLRAFGRRRTSTRGRTERIAVSPDEANVPAQEAPSRQGARLPRTHADAGRPAGDCRSAGTRSEATDGLTPGRGSNSPRLVMLSRPQDFAAVQGSGTSRSNPLLSARFLRTDLETTRFGLSTGRKLGGAVVRNRVRRRLREALRVMAPSFQPGWDVLIIARPAIVEADHATLVGALRRLLHRGGVIGGPATT